MPSGAKIWILVRGRRGDVQPLIALALGLQEAGHDVKAFGIGLFAEWFASFGLAYEALDREIAWQSPERVAWLCGQAQGLGLGGPDELLLDLDLRKHEVLHWQWLSSLRARVPLCSVLELLMQEQERMEESRLNAGLDLDAHADRERRRYCEMLELQAESADVDVSTFETTRQQRRWALACGLREMAAESGAKSNYGARALLAALEMLVAGQLYQLVRTNGAEANGDRGRRCSNYEAAVEILEELTSWQGRRDIGEYLQAWRERLPAWDLWHGPFLDKLQTVTSTLARRNLLFRAEQLEVEEQPSLVLYAPLMVGAALALQKRHGLNVIAAWPRMPVLTSLRQGEIFRLLFEEEQEGEKDTGEALSMAKSTGNLQSGSPLKQLGPVALSSLLRSPVQMLGASPALLLALDAAPAELRCDEEWLKPFMSRMTGHWHLSEEQERLPSEPNFFGGLKAKEQLQRFLAEGEKPPIYLGWGSSQHPKGPKALVTLVVKALRIAKRRGIFVSNWCALDRKAFWEALQEAQDQALETFAERNVLLLRAAPHAWLMPKCACTVTHGGNGTLDLALRAGVPTILAPVGPELLSKGRQLTSMGCGLGVLETLGELTAWKLATAVKVVLGDSVMKARARELAESLRGEAGVTGAVGHVGQILRGEEGALPSAPQEAPGVWTEGIYDTFNAEGHFVGRAEVVGGKVWLLANPTPSMWLRAGSFLKRNGHGKQVRCNVEAFFADGVRHATISEDGQTWTWLSGEIYRFKEHLSKGCECTVS